MATWLEDCIENSGYGLVSDQRNLWPYTNPYTAKDYQYDIDNGVNWETDENQEDMFAVNDKALGIDEHCMSCRIGGCSKLKCILCLQRNSSEKEKKA